MKRKKKRAKKIAKLIPKVKRGRFKRKTPRVPTKEPSTEVILEGYMEL